MGALEHVKATFSAETKQELCSAEGKGICCEKAECCALLLFSRFLLDPQHTVNFENSSVGRHMAQLTASSLGIIPEFSINLRKKGCSFSIPGKDQQAIIESQFSLNNLQETCKKLLKNNCCVQSFIRGAFLACGTVADPQKQYELDFAMPNLKVSQLFVDILKNHTGLGLQPGQSERSYGYVVYLKDSAQIEDILTYMGATNSSMYLMQAKMYKEAVNNINRKSNFETANMDKTYSASAKQTAAIAVINDMKGLDSLEPSMARLAWLRLENPDMTLNDMAKALGISRSSVNNRLQKLIKLAVELMGEKSIF